MKAISKIKSKRSEGKCSLLKKIKSREEKKRLIAAIVAALLILVMVLSVAAPFIGGF